VWDVPPCLSISSWFVPLDDVDDAQDPIPTIIDLEMEYLVVLSDNISAINDSIYKHMFMDRLKRCIQHG
jgi:hypothetical protein